MSTVSYALLINGRQAAKQEGDSSASVATTRTAAPLPDEKKERGDGGSVRTYVDVFAAMVPAEVLTLHAIIISVTTTSGTASPATQPAGASIIPSATAVLYWAFWGLLALSILLYLVPRLVGGKWETRDWIRVCISPIAFVGWTMLQRVTAFDAIAPTFDPIARTVVALFLGAALSATVIFLPPPTKT